MSLSFLLTLKCQIESCGVEYVQNNGPYHLQWRLGTIIMGTMQKLVFFLVAFFSETFLLYLGGCFWDNYLTKFVLTSSKHWFIFLPKYKIYKNINTKKLYFWTFIK